MLWHENDWCLKWQFAWWKCKEWKALNFELDLFFIIWFPGAELKSNGVAVQVESMLNKVLWFQHVVKLFHRVRKFILLHKYLRCVDLNFLKTLRYNFKGYSKLLYTMVLFFSKRKLKFSASENKCLRDLYQAFWCNDFYSSKSISVCYLLTRMNMLIKHIICQCLPYIKTIKGCCIR